MFPETEGSLLAYKCKYRCQTNNIQHIIGEYTKRDEYCAAKLARKLQQFPHQNMSDDGRRLTRQTSVATNDT